MDLTREQAEALVVLLACVGGDPDKSRRGCLSRLAEQLTKALGDDNEYVLASEDDGAFVYLDATELGIYFRNESDQTTPVISGWRERDRKTAEATRLRINAEFGLTPDGTAKASA